jgi:hypothetical protein
MFLGFFLVIPHRRLFRNSKTRLILPVKPVPDQFWDDGSGTQ